MASRKRTSKRQRTHQSHDSRKGKCDEDDQEARVQDKGRAAKRSGSARSDHLAWVQKLQTKSNKTQIRTQLQMKRLRKKVACAGPDAIGTEHAELLCSLALIQRQQQHTQELDSWKKALVADPANVDARNGLLNALMDAAEAVEARAICDRFPDDHSTAFAWSRALLEYLSCHVLEEDGTSPDVAATALRSAFTANPFVTLFMAHCDGFTEMIGPDRIEELLADRSRRQRRMKRDDSTALEADTSALEALAAAALDYCLVGVSCWMDAPEGLEYACAAAEEQAAVKKALKLLALSKNAVADLPCTRLFRGACIQLDLLKDVVPPKPVKHAPAKKEATGQDVGKDGLTNRQRTKRARRRNSGYKRCKNRKKNIFGGNSNDLCVYIE